MSKPGFRQAVEILLVEDDAALREALTDCLQEQGYSVAAVDNGQLALDYLRAYPFTGVILLDLAMPEMDGYQFLAEQRKDPDLEDIPVIIMSVTEPRKGRVGVSSGVFLSKPFDLPRLFAAIETLGHPTQA